MRGRSDTFDRTDVNHQDPEEIPPTNVKFLEERKDSDGENEIGELMKDLDNTDELQSHLTLSSKIDDLNEGRNPLLLYTCIYI